MALRRGDRRPCREEGFALIEVVVSALIAVTVTGGVISLLNVTGRAGAELRHRAQAYSIAQEDQARLRGMPISGLNKFSEPARKVSLDGTEYTVNSTGTFVNDKTAELTCANGVGSADYVRIRSEVTWPTLKAGRVPVVIESIVTPPTGSLDPTRGTLVVSAVNAQETPISGVGISGTGPGTLSGSTDSTGCAIFPDMPEGTYTITPSLASGYVDKNGDAPHAETAGVAGNSTTTKKLQYDLGGSLNVGFSVRNYSGSIVASKADSLVYANNQMTVTQKTMGTPGGTEKSSFAITPLFPFANSAYTVFAGCKQNEPESGEAKPSALVSPAATASLTVRLPPLYATVWTGRNSSNKGSAFNLADVWVDDDNCTAVRRFPTNSSGQLADPGLPWSQYDLCADNNSGSSPRRQRINNVSVKNLTAGTAVNFYLGSGTGTVSESGSCP